MLALILVQIAECDHAEPEDAFSGWKGELLQPFFPFESKQARQQKHE